MPLFRRGLIAAGLSLAFSPASAAAPSVSRFALVIGNGAYSRGILPLPNPPRDAQALALALERLGFKVELLLDADGAAMRAAIQRLGTDTQGAEAALLFYAGHAAEVGGQNLLFPVSVSLNASALVREAVAYDEVAAALSGKARTTLIFFDACRDNPFIGTEAPAPARTPRGQRTPIAGATRSVGTGLAGVFSPAGTLIAYATAPGRVALDGNGQHSPFTTALLQNIETPDIEVRDMLTRVRRTVRQATNDEQVPWDNSSLDVAFYMRTAVTPNSSLGPTRRIVVEASALGIPLPADIVEEKFQRPAAGVGPAAQLVGSWSGGDRRWGGRSGRRNILVVLAVNESRGTADAIFAQGAVGNDDHPERVSADPTTEPYYQRRVMMLTRATATLAYALPNGGLIQFQLIGSDRLLAVLVLKDEEITGSGTRQVRTVRMEMNRID